MQKKKKIIISWWISMCKFSTLAMHNPWCTTYAANQFRVTSILRGQGVPMIILLMHSALQGHSRALSQKLILEASKSIYFYCSLWAIILNLVSIYERIAKPNIDLGFIITKISKFWVSNLPFGSIIRSIESWILIVYRLTSKPIKFSSGRSL